MDPQNVAALAGRLSADNWKNVFFGWNWYVPSWLAWIPSLSAEGAPAQPPEVAGLAPAGL